MGCAGEEGDRIERRAGLLRLRRRGGGAGGEREERHQDAPAFHRPRAMSITKR